MSEEHTPEPWLVITNELPHHAGGKHLQHSIVTAWTHPQLRGAMTVVGLGVGLGKNKGDPPVSILWLKAADARRIVACVNACAGVSTEVLEALPFSAAVAEESRRHREAVQQRDELVAAARQAQKWIARQMLELGWPQERVDSPPEGSHLFNLRAAIAKATGGA